jgi:hypothetical protein
MSIRALSWKLDIFPASDDRRKDAYSAGFGRKGILSVPSPVPQNLPKFDMDDSE